MSILIKKQICCLFCSKCLLNSYIKIIQFYDALKIKNIDLSGRKLHATIATLLAYIMYLFLWYIEKLVTNSCCFKCTSGVQIYSIIL